MGERLEFVTLLENVDILNSLCAANESHKAELINKHYILI